MIAQIRNGQIIQTFNGEQGWFTWEDGSKACPPRVGMSNGNDSIVAVTETVVGDPNDPANDRTDRSLDVVDGAAVLTVTHRPSTQAEIDAQRDVEFDRIDRMQNLYLLDLTRRVFALQQNSGMTNAQMNTAIANSPVTGAMLRARVMELINA